MVGLTEEPKKIPKLLIDGRRSDAILWLVLLNITGVYIISRAWFPCLNCTPSLLPESVNAGLAMVAGWLLIVVGVSIFLKRWVKGVQIAAFDDHIEFFTEYLSLVMEKNDVHVSFYAMEAGRGINFGIGLRTKPRVVEYLQFFDKVQDDVIVLCQSDMSHEDWFDLKRYVSNMPNFKNKYADVALIAMRKQRAFIKRNV